jgi:hypothetical protein
MVQGLLPALLVGAAALLLIACGGGSSPTPAPTPVSNVCRPNPAPAATNLRPADCLFREVDQPKAGATVRSPLLVSGRANPFEGAFSVTVFNAGAQQVTSQNFFKDNGVLAFTVSVPFSVSSPTPACVWVHESSGKDGSPVNITQIPVVLLP